MVFNKQKNDTELLIFFLQTNRPIIQKIKIEMGIVGLLHLLHGAYTMEILCKE